jgi:hypothetical protein
MRDFFTWRGINLNVCIELSKAKSREASFLGRKESCTCYLRRIRRIKKKLKEFDRKKLQKFHQFISSSEYSTEANKLVKS